jgi:hypothetical protein
VVVSRLRGRAVRLSVPDSKEFGALSFFTTLHAVRENKATIKPAKPAKPARYVVRLLNQGIESMRSGTITLPRPEKELLITIRTGNYGSLARVVTLANRLFAETRTSQAKSMLPEKVDRTKISEVVSPAYLGYGNGSS